MGNKDIKSGTERISSIARNLANEFRERPVGYDDFSSGYEVDSDFIRDLNTISTLVEEKGILVSNSTLRKHSFGRNECWRYLAEYLDDHFMQVIEIYNMVSEKETEALLPSEQIKSPNSFEKWHDEIVNCIDRLRRVLPFNICFKKLDTIRLLTSAINNTFVDSEIRYCRYCFRRVTTKNNCRYHMAISDEFYMEVKKADRFLDKDRWAWIAKQREIRKIIGEQPYKNEFYKEAGAIAKFIDNEDWEESSKVLTLLFDSELKHIKKFLVSKMFTTRNQALFPLVESFEDYPQFVSWAYDKSVMDNRFEDSKAAFWFMNNLFAADTRLKAEFECDNESNSVRKRQEECFNLKKMGYSYREIGRKLGISKSMVGKILSKT